VKAVSCLRCDLIFVSELDRWGVPVFRLCEDCRRYASDNDV
jgi:hypothetical protein